MPSTEACATLQSRISAVSFALKKLRRSHPEQRAAIALLRVIEKNGEVRASELAAQVGVGLSTVSRQVDYLIAEGFLTRVPEQKDGRASLLAVTKGGHKALAKQFDMNTAELKMHLADWTDADIVKFANYLERFENSVVNAGKNESIKKESTRV